MFANLDPAMVPRRGRKTCAVSFILDDVATFVAQKGLVYM